MARTIFNFRDIWGNSYWYVQPTTASAIEANGVCECRQHISPPPQEQVALCIEFLQKCKPCSRPTITSYTLKHIIEKLAGQYVCNGAVIEAAKRLEIKYFVSKTPRSNPNAVIAVSRRSIVRAGTEMRKAGGKERQFVTL